ncbi:hypothetical protein NLM16_09115 [Bradyrhizobium brasilense]|uniref:hypothetical protein n=1 Tax=Bradyrhizobium brasilense TaxID=1419277 RepID=UPI002877FDB3|nr:hypothetical protein [Bradyrhizobium brasilense]MCP3414258.1 hypothetical protein [Bradyrhizobium brasilense]
MDIATEPHLPALKAALKTLHHSGPTGFEGLLAAVLSEICDQPFRLASSGSQRGRDGDSAFDDAATYFEAKLYTDDVPPAAVTGKIVDLAADDEGQVDTWILCATSEVPALNADTYRSSLATFGVGCVILDWPATTLPTLAVLLAMAASRVEQFVLAHSKDPSSVAGIRADLDAVAADSQFAPMSKELTSTLRDESIGLGMAKAANRMSLIGAFSDRGEARRMFGQPLAPLDPSGLPWAERSALVQKIQAMISGKADDRVVAVLGGEGAGKSWLVAKGWSEGQQAPLLVVFMASEMPAPRAIDDIEALLVSKLSAHAGETLTDNIRKRWARRFKSWRANPDPDNVRIVVWVDGLNQAASLPWHRWIDGIARFLKRVGGRLIVTTNNWHHAEIRFAVTSATERVVVEEWSASELKDILDARGIKSDVLAPEVFDFLRNPRILGIAVELLDAKEIERVDELTVERLLFEHIRRHDRDAMNGLSAREFAKELRTHAEQMLERLTKQERDDLTIFDLGKNLGAVSKGRFFEPVPGDGDLYAVRKEGLALALGLALIGILGKEIRADRDPIARLAEVTEPVNALSETSDVVFSALQISFLREDCPLEVQAALARFFVGLQNVPDNLYPAFKAFAKRAPAAFLKATYDAAFSRVRLPNARWLVAALSEASSDPANAAEISKEASRWLCLHSLAPEAGMFRNMGRGAAKEAEQLERLRSELDARRLAMSSLEREFVSAKLQERPREGLPQLHLFALELLAGMPLKTAVPALTAWSYARALNADVNCPDSQFRHLIRFNSVDWRKTRDAMRIACEPFLTGSTSPTAKRAAITMLGATGDPDDAARAREALEELDRDEKRLIWPTDPTYSKVDPCDPSTQTPENIGAIVEANRNVSVGALSTGVGMTAEDHMSTRSLPVIARFELPQAIELRRAFAREAVGRTDPLPRRQAIMALLKDSAILESSIIDELVSKGTSQPASEFLSDKGQVQDEWLAQQYSLRASFPHKSGDEQLRILVAHGGSSTVGGLLESTRPAAMDDLDAAFERAEASGNGEALLTVLTFAQFSDTPLSGKVKARVGHLLASTDAALRMRAMGIAARLRDPELLRIFLATGWQAANCHPKTGYHELWHGSRCLLFAAELGLTDFADAVGRMGAGFYGFAAESTDEGTKAAAGKIDVAFHCAITMNDIPRFPLVEQPVTADEEQEPPLVSLVDPPDWDDEEKFRQGQKRSWQAFDRFVEKITLAEARIILDDFSWGGFDAIVSQNPTLAESWKRLLLGASDGTFRAMHAFATGLARAIAPVDAAGAGELFERIVAQRPYINLTIGVSSIPAEAVAAWSRASVPEVRRQCFARLDRAANDAQMAVEVLAAERGGARQFVQEYVDAQLALGEPAKMARALLVCGFSDVSDHASRTLERFANREGFIGDAHRAATYAYRRNEWSRHWYFKMKTAANPEEFWQYSVLFTKIVDGRFDLWEAEPGSAGDTFARFFTTVQDEIEKRVKKWQSERQSKLFGLAIPDPIFTRYQQ